MATSKKRHSV